MARKRSERRGPRVSGHQAGPGTVVSLDYELLDAEGECVERSEPDAPLEILLGYGVAPASLERAIEGLGVGASREVVLRPEEAFGPRDPEAILEVDRAEFPPDLAPGDELSADREDGSGTVELKVLDVRDDVVVLDTNHPLAGQRVVLHVVVRAVRPATSEEMNQATLRLAGAGAGGGAGGGGDVPEGGGPLLPVERLLKRGRGSLSGGGDEPPPSPPPGKRVA